MSKLYGILKWLILIAAYFFLAYKLLTFNQYDLLIQQWKQMPLSQFWWLVVLLLLMPLNWLLEAQKWKILCSKTEALSLISAYKAVLAGISTGFVTPNRIGEMLGRVMYLKEENRKTGVSLSLINSLSQNLIMVLCGVPASFLYFGLETEFLSPDIRLFLSMLLVGLMVFGIMYFALPFLSTKITKGRFSNVIASFTIGIGSFKKLELSQVIFISLLRYGVFCAQFYFMLQFFGVEISIFHAMIAIPASYLFVTFTPSVAFSEAAIRSSYAVVFLGVFSNQTVEIALSGICIWVINFVLPMLVGSVLMVKKNR